jgi:hypothetical protein
LSLISLFFILFCWLVLSPNYTNYYQYNVKQTNHNSVGARGKKPPISDTSYRLSFTKGPVAPGGSAEVEGAESGEEREELVLED